MGASRKFNVFERIVKPGEYKPREDAVDIFLTDIQFHAQKPNHPRTFTRNIASSLKKDELDRSFSSGFKVRDSGQIEVSFGFDEDELLTLLQKRGKKILRIYIPRAGMTMDLAQDAVEKLKSIEKKLFEKPRPKR